MFGFTKYTYVKVFSPNSFQFRQAVSAVYQKCYFSKEIRGPVFSRFEKEHFIAKFMSICIFKVFFKKSLKFFFRQLKKKEFFLKA